MNTIKSIGVVGAAVVIMTLCGGYAAEAQSMSSFCQGEYNKYRAARGPKAFATGSDGSCWWGRGQSDLASAQRFAMDACVKGKRPGCRVVESSF